MEEKTVEESAKVSEKLANIIASPKSISVTEIVDRLEALVRYALECEDKPLKDDVSFIEVYRQLIEVQKAINALDKDQKELISMMAKLSGLSPGELSHVRSEDTHNIEKLKMLEKMCGDAQERLHASLEGQKEAGRSLKEKIEDSSMSQKKKAILRKGKFKKMGGAGGWVRT